LFLATAGGVVKKISAADLPGPSSQVYTVMNVGEEDGLAGARLTTGADEVLLVTSAGRAIRFKEAEVRAMGLGAAGVIGIKNVARDEKVIGFDLVKSRADAFLVTDAGMGKRTSLAEFPTQGRAGMGVSAAALAGKQRLVGAVTGYAPDRLVLMTNRGGRLLAFGGSGRKGRAARGSGVVKLKDREVVTGLVPLVALVEAPEPARPRRGKASKAKQPGRGSARRQAAGKRAARKSTKPKKRR
jgi:DNA gyrase subunit A